MHPFSPFIIAALSFVSLGLSEKITFTGSPAARARLISAYRVPSISAYKAPSIVAKRQDNFANGIALVDGAGGPKRNGTAGEAKKPGEGAAAGGLSRIDKARKKADEALKKVDEARQRLDGAKGSEDKAGGEKATPAEGEKAAPAEEEKAAPAEGEKAAPAKGEKAAGEGAKAEDLTAVKEGEQFDGNQGITVDRNGNTKNLGGSAGITKGSDGSTSVGGAAGINILSIGSNVAAEEEVEQFEEAE